MRRLGKVLHLTRRGLVVKADQPAKIGKAVYNGKKKKIGEISDIFGPIRGPYLAIKPSGLDQAELSSLVGKDLYIMGERRGGSRKKVS